ncbi:Tetratricopeptide repeat protein 16 [Phlyctochytrium planicorne]|nr:Tetratricopeptide repeat protein 16 [Phlyctochytrium planicorne]
MKILSEKADANNINGLDSLTHQDPSMAICWFSRSIFLDANEPSYFVNRAEAFLKATDMESAIANYFTALNMIEKWPGGKTSLWIQRRLRKVCFVWAQILLDQRRFKDAMHQLQMAKGFGMNEDAVLSRMTVAYIGMSQFDNALELLYSLTCRNPEDPEYFILRAKIYRHMGNVDFVNIDTQKAIQLAPSHPEIKGLLEYIMLVAIRYKNKASDQILKGQYDTAIYFLNHALELDPMDWVLLFKRGILFSEIGHFESAIVDLSSVLEHPEYDKRRETEIKAHLGSVYNKLGVDYFQKGIFGDALNSFTTALTYNATEPAIYKNRADCYIRFGMIENTLKDLTIAWDLNPSDEEARKKSASIRFQLAEKHLALGDLASATIDLTKAVTAVPTEPLYLFERAKVYYLQEMIDAVRSDLQSVLELDPGHREASAFLLRLQSGPPLNNLLPFPPQKPVQKSFHAKKQTETPFPLPQLSINTQASRSPEQQSRATTAEKEIQEALELVELPKPTPKVFPEKKPVLTLVTPSLF